MGQLLPLPLDRAIAVPDVRGGRALQVTWHDDDGLVVVSVWHAGRCTASVRLSAEGAAALIGVLAEGLERRERARPDGGGAGVTTAAEPERRTRPGDQPEGTAPVS